MNMRGGVREGKEKYFYHAGRKAGTQLAKPAAKKGKRGKQEKPRRNR